MTDRSKKVWLDIVEYAKYRGKSISTIRRYIKSNRLPHKMQKGKFYILVASEDLQSAGQDKGDRLEVEMLQIKLENKRLKEELNKAREEKTDLEMLVNLYEKKQKTPEPEQEIR